MSCRRRARRVLDWWASALDREARPRPDIERQRDVPADPRLGWKRNSRRTPGSAAAAYWLAAAARAQGDLQAAWDAAEAGWVRAPLTAERGAALRADVDRLVVRAIVPERRAGADGAASGDAAARSGSSSRSAWKPLNPQ